MSRKKQRTYFLYLLCCYLKANPGCLAEVSSPVKGSAQSPLLGYSTIPIITSDRK